MMPDFGDLIGRLVDGDVRFVIIGGISLVIHGSSRVTRDLDICYARDAQNIERLARALRPLSPTLRGAPADLPFVLDAATLKAGLNFTLTSTAGAIDLFGEVSGIGTFDVALRLSEPVTLYEHVVNVLTLDGLERAKRAAGRMKDLLDLADILEIRKQQKDAEQ